MKYPRTRIPPFAATAFSKMKLSPSQAAKATAAQKEIKEFPWITCLRATVGSTTTAAPAGTEFKFIRHNGQEPAFYNNTDKRIFVDEMRIAATNVSFEVPQGENEKTLMSNYQLGTIIETPQDVYVDQWMPLGYLCNVTNRFLRFPQLKGAYKLPTPYKLDMKNPMRLRIRQQYQSDNVGDNTMWFSLFGTGADGFPIYLIKRLNLPLKNPFNPPYHYEILFDEDRDRALRDAMITHVGFGFGPLNEADVYDPEVAPTTVLSLLELQLRPLGGPLWMREDDYIPLWMLQDQPGMLWPISSNLLETDYSQMIHRFESPVVLEPKQEITVRLRVLETYDNVLYDIRGFFGENSPIWCAFYGRQEAEV